MAPPIQRLNVGGYWDLDICIPQTSRAVQVVLVVISQSQQFPTKAVPHQKQEVAFAHVCGSYVWIKRMKPVPRLGKQIPILIGEHHHIFWPSRGHHPIDKKQSSCFETKLVLKASSAKMVVRSFEVSISRDALRSGAFISRASVCPIFCFVSICIL